MHVGLSEVEPQDSCRQGALEQGAPKRSFPGSLARVRCASGSAAGLGDGRAPSARFLSKKRLLCGLQLRSDTCVLGCAVVRGQQVLVSFKSLVASRCFRHCGPQAVEPVQPSDLWPSSCSAITSSHVLGPDRTMQGLRSEPTLGGSEHVWGGDGQARNGYVAVKAADDAGPQRVGPVKVRSQPVSALTADLRLERAGWAEWAPQPELWTQRMVVTDCLARVLHFLTQLTSARLSGVKGSAQGQAASCWRNRVGVACGGPRAVL